MMMCYLLLTICNNDETIVCYHSVMSSGLNAMAAVLLEDYIKPFCCIDVKGLKAKVVSMTIGKYKRTIYKYCKSCPLQYYLKL